MSQGPLSRLLQSWSHTPAPAPAFGREVWARIAARQRGGWRGWVAEFFAWHRWVVGVGAAALFAVGLIAGVLAGREAGRAAERERLAATFASNTDPFLILAANTTSPGYRGR